VVVVLTAGLVSAYQVGVRQHRPPHFRRGGPSLSVGTNGLSVSVSANVDTDISRDARSGGFG